MGGTGYGSDVFLKDFSGKKDLEIYLTERLARARKHAKLNYFAAYTCYAVAIAASLFGTIVAATEFLPKVVLIILTAIPGSVLLVNSVFSLDKKATWHYKRASHYNGVLRRLRFEDLSLADASKTLRNFSEKMEAEYPKFGMMPHQSQPSPHKPAPRL